MSAAARTGGPKPLWLCSCEDACRPAPAPQPLIGGRGWGKPLGSGALVHSTQIFPEARFSQIPPLRFSPAGGGGCRWLWCALCIPLALWCFFCSKAARDFRGFVVYHTLWHAPTGGGGAIIRHRGEG